MELSVNTLFQTNADYSFLSCCYRNPQLTLSEGNESFNHLYPCYGGETITSNGTQEIIQSTQNHHHLAERNHMGGFVIYFVMSYIAVVS